MSPQVQHIVLSYCAPIGSILLLLVVGLLTLRKRLTGIYDKQNFAEEFRNRFIGYCNSRGEDREAYTWLTLNSPRMQREMGSYGTYEAFQPPAANYMIKNYQIITNMIPEIRRYINLNNESMGTMFASTIDSYIKNVDEALLRYIGVLTEREEQEKTKVLNPLIWLRTGVEQILSTPLLIFMWFGLVGVSAVYRLQNSIVFKFLALITAIIGLLSGAMTIILGWEQFSEIISNKFF